MNTYKALISGFTGAVTMTALHQFIKNVTPEAPKLDIFGMRLLSKVLNGLGLRKPGKKNLFQLSLVSDLLLNTIYYSFTAAGKKPLLKGSLLGIQAGTGVISIPEIFGIGKKQISASLKQKALTMGIYLTGGLAAAGTYKLLNSK
ncbi:MAG: hypothetical protein ACK40G_07755 [Cytophagaceae bacterium]